MCKTVSLKSGIGLLNGLQNQKNRHTEKPLSTGFTVLCRSTKRSTQKQASVCKTVSLKRMKINCGLTSKPNEHILYAIAVTKKIILPLSKMIPLVPVIGVEPIRYRYHWILSPARLPIPSHRRIAFIIFHLFEKIKPFSKKYL